MHGSDGYADRACDTPDGYAVAKDAQGNVLDESGMSISVVGAGETSIDYFLFYHVTDVDSVGYELSYDTDTGYTPILNDLDITYNDNGSNVSISVTNNGVYATRFLRATCLFLDKNNDVIKEEFGYIESDLLGINPGETVYSQINLWTSIGDYDHVEVYFSGYGVEPDEEAVSVNDEDFTVEEYVYTYSNTSTYYLVITNNSTETVYIDGSGALKDADGRLLQTSQMSSIETIGPGETSVLRMYFSGVREDAVDMEYALWYWEPRYTEPFIGNLATDIVIEDKTVVVSATNYGDSTARYVYAVVLYLDENGEIVDDDSGYLTDNDYEIKSGATVSKEFDSYKQFESVLVYYK